ncbi:MAG: hypothetical protein ACSHWQ_09615 [Spongiibacteraceae bacterium]
MNRLLILIVLLLPIAAAATELRVAAGETYRIEAAEQSLELDRLELADGARIVVAPELRHWQLRAAEVDIGRNVVIDGRGHVGADGVALDICSDEAIASGEAGTSGVAMTLELGLSQLGDLTILSAGGNGGAGASANSACRDDDGKSGGNGGDAGDGGDVRLAYRVLQNGMSAADVRARLTIQNGAGKPGRAGASGKPAERGHYVKRKSLTGGRVWVADNAVAVDAAEDGAPGRVGERQLQELRGIASSSQGLAPQLQALEARLQQLIQRVERLEAR